MESLEERYQLLAFLRGALSRNQVYLRIGPSCPTGASSGLSMVAANYGVARRNLGTVSLFGPTRMDYRLAMATVRGAAQILSELRRGGVRRMIDEERRSSSTTASRSSRSGAGPCAATRRRPCGCWRRSRPAPTGPRSTRSASAPGRTPSSSPLLDEADLFTGLSFAEAHWVAAVLASAADRVEDAESLLFDLRVPVDLAWREVELASEVVEPGGLRSAPLVPWEPEAECVDRPSRYAIAIYTLDCGHQAVELLRQDPDAAPVLGRGRARSTTSSRATRAA